MAGPGVPGSPELGCRELKGQAEVEEEEFCKIHFLLGGRPVLL